MHLTNFRNLAKKVIIFVIAIILFQLLFFNARAESDSLEVVFFYNDPCSSCDMAGDLIDYFNEVTKTESEGINVIIETKNSFKMSAESIEEFYSCNNVPINKRSTPLLIIGDTYLMGFDEIYNNLKQVFINEKTKFTQTNNEKPLLIEYFYVNPCAACEEVEISLDKIENIYRDKHKVPGDFSELKLSRNNISISSSEKKLKEYFNSYQVKEEDRSVPIIFFQENYLSGKNEIQSYLTGLIESKNDTFNDIAKSAKKSTDLQDNYSLEESVDDNNAESNDVYFLYSSYCESCQEAEKFLITLQKQKQFQIIKYEINEDNEEFKEILQKHSITSPTVPIIIYKNSIWKGYNSVFASEIADALEIDATDIDNQFLFWDVTQLSVVLATIVIGFTDGFNPCSIWALLFLMSMILRFKSRKVILTLGFTYVLVVSLVYGLFITGTFKIVSIFTEHFWLRIILFVFAFIFALFNIRSFFEKKDTVFSISSKNKKKFIQNIRSKFYSKNSFFGLIVAAVMIALIASIIELPCTAGLPIIWNAIMAENGVSVTTYISLLILYLIMYILVEMVIVIFMVITLTKKHINEFHGKYLKLVSGMLMAYLSFLLLLGEKYLNNAMFVIGGSIILMVITFIVAYLKKQVLLFKS